VDGLLAAVVNPSMPIESAKFNPIVPKTANHMIDTSAGAAITPPINSLIVLPFDIRAINVPTNGAHAIHHAQ
jgi:hypothetical protein